MKIKLYFILPFFCLFTGLVQAQGESVIGTWILDEIILEDFIDEDLVFTKEESFFGYYLNPNETMQITETTMEVVVGGMHVNCDYRVEGAKLILSQDNNVMILKDGELTNQVSSGETDFRIKISDGLLILSRRNITFFESYTFLKTQ